jgi:hypothetical protein
MSFLDKSTHRAPKTAAIVHPFLLADSRISAMLRPLWLFAWMPPKLPSMVLRPIHTG